MPIYVCQPGRNDDEPWRHVVQVYASPFAVDEKYHHHDHGAHTKAPRSRLDAIEVPVERGDVDDGEAEGGNISGISVGGGTDTLDGDVGLVGFRSSAAGTLTETTSQELHPNSRTPVPQSGTAVPLRRVRHSEILLADRVSSYFGRYWLRLRFPGPSGGFAGYVALGPIGGIGEVGVNSYSGGVGVGGDSRAAVLRERDVITNDDVDPGTRAYTLWNYVNSACGWGVGAVPAGRSQPPHHTPSSLKEEILKDEGPTPADGRIAEIVSDVVATIRQAQADGRNVPDATSRCKDYWRDRTDFSRREFRAVWGRVKQLALDDITGGVGVGIGSDGQRRRSHGRGSLPTSVTEPSGVGGGEVDCGESLPALICIETRLPYPTSGDITLLGSYDDGLKKPGEDDNGSGGDGGAVVDVDRGGVGEEEKVVGGGYFMETAGKSRKVLGSSGADAAALRTSDGGGVSRAEDGGVFEGSDAEGDDDDCADADDEEEEDDEDDEEASLLCEEEGLGNEPVFCRICREGLHDVEYDPPSSGAGEVDKMDGTSADAGAEVEVEAEVDVSAGEVEASAESRRRRRQPPRRWDSGGNSSNDEDGARRGRGGHIGGGMNDDDVDEDRDNVGLQDKMNPQDHGELPDASMQVQRNRDDNVPRRRDAASPIGPSSPLVPRPLSPREIARLKMVSACHPSVENPLLSPCECSGSMAFVHYLCVEQWRCRSRHPAARFGTHCETCGVRYTLPPPLPRADAHHRERRGGVGGVGGGVVGGGFGGGGMPPNLNVPFLEREGGGNEDWIEAMPPHVLAALRRPHFWWQVGVSIVRRRYLRPLAPVLISPMVALYCRARRILKKRGVSRRRWSCSLCRRRARWKCVRCLRSYYCSRQCQNVSWHILHKHVCYKPSRFWWSVAVYVVGVVGVCPGMLVDPMPYAVGAAVVVPSCFVVVGVLGGGLASAVKRSLRVDVRGRYLEMMVVLGTCLMSYVSWGPVWGFFGYPERCIGILQDWTDLRGEERMSDSHLVTDDASIFSKKNPVSFFSAEHVAFFTLDLTQLLLRKFILLPSSAALRHADAVLARSGFLSSIVCIKNDSARNVGDRRREEMEKMSRLSSRGRSGGNREEKDGGEKGGSAAIAGAGIAVSSAWVPFQHDLWERYLGLAGGESDRVDGRSIFASKEAASDASVASAFGERRLSRPHSVVDVCLPKLHLADPDFLNRLGGGGKQCAADVRFLTPAWIAAGAIVTLGSLFKRRERRVRFRARGANRDRDHEQNNNGAGGVGGGGGGGRREAAGAGGFHGLFRQMRAQRPQPLHHEHQD